MCIRDSSTDSQEWIGQTVTVKWGLSHSSNNISAFLMKQFGPTAMAQMMRRMGISTHLEEVYSLCVGSADIPLYQMVAAYNTFPSKGVYVTPQYVTRIEDNSGNVLSDFSNRKREAISAATAYQMVNLMQSVVNEGTGMRLRFRYGLTGQIAGKTGTTNDNSDGWFIGYTPDITAGVWVGGENRQVHFNDGSKGQGANMALPIWGIWMKKCLADGSLNDTDVFVAPAGVSADLSCPGGGVFLGGDEGAESSGNGSSEKDYYFN